MLLAALLLVVGLVLLVGGGEALVRGSTGLARSLGVSQLVIGLTVVAFGTSAPELAVNLIAAWQGRGEISFGNIIGSNMANIGLIVGCAALIRPIVIDRVVVLRELPTMLLATAAAVVMALDRWLSDSPNLYDRSDGILLLMLFGVFLYYTIFDFMNQRANNHGPEIGSEGLPPRRLARELALLAAGLVALLAGARISVDAAVELARGLGVPEVIIGLTLLAVGTSLPELAASVVASLRGHVGLAIGNVVGSNIFNLLLVAGVTAILHPIPIPPVGGRDLLVLTVLSLVLMGVSLTRRRQIVRTEAVALLLIYFGYLVWRAGFSVRL
jgi:cation:H+ antiporter